MATSICSSTRSYGLLSPQIQTFPLTRSLWAGCSINPSPSKNFFFRLHHLRKARSQSPGNHQGFTLRRNAVSCGVAVISESDFEEEVVRSDIPVLVEFVASWCGPCRLIAPAIEWASEEYKGRLKVVKIDHDLNPKLIEEYKVYGLPALILFKNGQEVGESRREGAITKVKLKEYLDSQLESVPTS